MAEILADGYQSIKDFVVSTTATPNDWDYIALYDDTQTEVMRVSISGDARADWVDVDGDPLISAEITVTGSDAEITLPTTLEYSAIFDDTSANGGRQVTATEQFATAQLDQSGDEATITHTVEVPDQV